MIQSTLSSRAAVRKLQAQHAPLGKPRSEIYQPRRDKSMKSAHKLSLIVAAVVCALALTAHAGDSKKEKDQNQIRKMAQDTLQALYKAEPRTKAAVKNAAGYAVFSDMGVKILLAGSGHGKGITINNKSKDETFMQMLEIQAGLGMGVEKFRVVFLFDTENGFDSFVNSGWEIRRTIHRRSKKRRQGWSDERSCVCLGWSLDVPIDRQGLGCGHQRDRHEILQG